MNAQAPPAYTPVGGDPFTGSIVDFPYGEPREHWSVYEYGGGPATFPTTSRERWTEVIWYLNCHQGNSERPADTQRQSRSPFFSPDDPPLSIFPPSSYRSPIAKPSSTKSLPPGSLSPLPSMPSTSPTLSQSSNQRISPGTGLMRALALDERWALGLDTVPIIPTYQQALIILSNTDYSRVLEGFMPDGRQILGPRRTATETKPNTPIHDQRLLGSCHECW